MGSDGYAGSQPHRSRVGFNPRSRVGSDRRPPPWTGLGGGFNPRSRVGSDETWGGNTDVKQTFQSTLPRGERRTISRKKRWRHVSIHAPAWGATPLNYHHGCNTTVSIHAPAWGATRSDLSQSFHDEVSIHAPAWGATRSSPAPVTVIGSFNPRSRVGSDLPHPHPPDQHPGVSIHAPAWGATRGGISRRPDRWFQSTLPRGERQNRRSQQ